MSRFLGKQRHVRLLPIETLDGVTAAETVKLAETKGCSTFCVASVHEGIATWLCVAVKRQIIVYELNT